MVTHYKKYDEVERILVSFRHRAFDTFETVTPTKVEIFAKLPDSDECVDVADLMYVQGSAASRGKSIELLVKSGVGGFVYTVVITAASSKDPSLVYVGRTALVIDDDRGEVPTENSPASTL